MNIYTALKAIAFKEDIPSKWLKDIKNKFNNLKQIKAVIKTFTPDADQWEDDWKQMFFGTKGRRYSGEIGDKDGWQNECGGQYLQWNRHYNYHGDINYTNDEIELLQFSYYASDSDEDIHTGL